MNPTPSVSRWKVIAGIALVAVVITIVFATFYPWLALLTGISLIASGIAYAAWPPMSQRIATWLQRPTPTTRSCIYFGAPAACYGIVLLALSQSHIRANWRESDTRAEVTRQLEDAKSATERDRLDEALKICAEMELKANSAEKTQVAAIRTQIREKEKAREIKAANGKVQQLVSDGQIFIIKRELDNAQSALETALNVPQATEFGSAQKFANQIAADRTALAKTLSEKGELASAKLELQRAIGVPTATATAEAQRLLADVCNREVVELVASARQQLAKMKRDEAADILTRAVAIQGATEIQDAKEMLREINSVRESEANERVARIMDEATKSSDAKKYDEAIQKLNGALAVPHSTQGQNITAAIQRVQNQQRMERERQVAMAKAEETRRVAEADQQRRERAAAEAARKAEEEHENNGLVLLRKTVEGKTGQFGGEITGSVVNRRKNKLRYVQITFNLYDKSGAQVGSAVANVNGLEPDGTWKFKATSFGKDFSTYKFDELTGF